jgi:RNA polymerase sigma factor (sigma-70 family)
MADKAPDSSTRVSLLIRVAQLGPIDQQAWREFVTYYGAKMYQWCQGWGLQDADAQDVTQQILLKLASILRTFTYDPARSFRAWLRTLTHHAWHDVLTVQHRAIPGSGDSGVVQRLLSIPARDDFCQRLEEAFDHELLQQAIDEVRTRVQPATWEAFRLTAFENIPPIEVACRLNKKVATVYMLRSKVQKMLRAELQRLGGKDAPEPASASAPAAQAKNIMPGPI